MLIMMMPDGPLGVCIETKACQVRTIRKLQDTYFLIRHSALPCDCTQLAQLGYTPTLPDLSTALRHRGKNLV